MPRPMFLVPGVVLVFIQNGKNPGLEMRHIKEKQAFFNFRRS